MIELILSLLIFLLFSNYIISRTPDGRDDTVGHYYDWDQRMHNADINKMKRELFREQRYAAAKARTLELQYMSG